MSSYAYVYLERLNKSTKKWELCTLYNKIQDENNKNKFEPVCLWEGQGMIRDILSNRNEYDFNDYCERAETQDDSEHFHKLSDEILEIYHEYDYEIDDDKETTIGNYVIPMFATYAQIEKYIKNYPILESNYVEPEYDEKLDKYIDKKIPNPMQEILDRINMVTDMANRYDWFHSSLYIYRIVFWVSY